MVGAGCLSQPQIQSQSQPDVFVPDKNLFNPSPPDVSPTPTSTPAQTDQLVTDGEWQSLVFWHDLFYSFSFRYPRSWGEVTIETMGPDEFVKGTRTMFDFSLRDGWSSSTDIPHISIESVGYQFLGPTDGTSIDFDAIDMSLSPEILSTKLKRDETKELVVEKVSIGGKKGLKLIETFETLDGELEQMVYYVVPKYDHKESRHFIVYSWGDGRHALDFLISTIQF